MEALCQRPHCEVLRLCARRIVLDKQVTMRRSPQVLERESIVSPRLKNPPWRNDGKGSRQWAISAVETLCQRPHCGVLRLCARRIVLESKSQCDGRRRCSKVEHTRRFAQRKVGQRGRTALRPGISKVDGQQAGRS